MSDTNKTHSTQDDRLLAAAFAKKTNAVVAAIHNVRKDGKNPHFGYAFAQDADVLRAVRRAAVDVGLSITPVSVRTEQVLNGSTNRSGKPEFRTTSRVTWRITDIETGYSELVCDWPGEAVEAEDKGINKSLTAARKYFLLNFFLIPTGDDPDSESGPDVEPPAKPKPVASPAAAYLKSVFSDEADRKRFLALCKEAGAAWQTVAEQAMASNLTTPAEVFGVVLKEKSLKEKSS